MTPIPGSCFPLVFLSPSLSGQMPDAVTLAPGSCLPLVALCLPVSAVRCRLRGRVSCLSPSLCGQMPDAVTLAPGSCLPLVSLCLDARCCDAGSGVVSPACLPVSPSPVFVMLAPGSCPLVSQSLRSDARCCDAGSGVVSRLFPCIWMPDAVTLTR